jgi:hypothetical protein
MTNAPLSALFFALPFIVLAIVLVGWLILSSRERRKERRRHEEALRRIEEMRKLLSVPPTVPQTQAELDKHALEHLGQVPANLSGGLVRADKCPPGMVEVGVRMPPGNDAMNQAMSAHEGGNGQGVSLVDPHKNSASFLGGD